ncbi:hypothetical protein GCM10008014_36780 [Paenibacillus silvae]|uniref:TerB family tellurite resistance protein n=1 Tax=Paenibacillus silvae TaxID=1325358 RepID=A0ABQ1ZH19_9BACL|nr:hypothetical protein [Paenibacillus silvae]GGH61392.1 hypothetical protein GCM10008014_36780 [Paenibacillus silvae]
MGNEYPKYVTEKAINSLKTKINFQQSETSYSQDWEYEVSDSSRIKEFMYLYENIELNKDEQFALMTVIVSSYNDALEEGKIDEEIQEKILFFLFNESDIHRNIILEWAMLDEEDLSNCYVIAPIMRELAKHLYG